ncbi:DNA helicase MCM9 [Pempheris klunzingeri]|uniref:DNA helicase MCM9 n=1 Tax=Pempheris klunzingeri TaxID=3127111 RepID=UPI00397EF009
MLMSPEQEALIGRVFESYLMEHHQGDLLQLITDPDEETHRPVVVNAMTLFEANMEVGDYFNAYPNDILALFDKVLQKTAMELSENTSSEHFGGRRTKEQRLRHTPHTRITGLPVCPELTRETIPRSRDVGHFLSVTGTVIRTSVTKVLEYERDYMCAKCRHVFTVQADFDQFYTFVQAVACPNPDGCNSYKFSCLSGGSEPAACRDYQEIKIQEQVQRLSVGSIPRSMVVVLEDDLVDSCKSGDDVTVYGVMCQRWKPLYDGSRCDVELVLKANNIEVNNQQAAATLLIKDAQKEFEDFWNSYKHDLLAGRNHILLSLCPQVFGMYVIKLAVAMVLAGGVQRIDSSGTKIRGECHMLLVGDPGTGKSQFLKYAAKVMPRSVLTAGIGSTSAGLTVAAVKDGGEWHLEAGALVLSDGGLCCIDEFNSIKEHDRISIHEAMEQQSISVAKAGMVCKLNTRTTILAATNPKGQYNTNEPLSVNVALASPLLSRFDLVLVLLDTRNAEWDRVISSFILEDRGLPVDSSSLWSMEKMKAYFSVIKRLQPQVSDEANSILTRYYQLQRQSDGRNAARTTIRMLESLSRLAEAHARLMYRETVTIEDAVMAVSVMECSMQGGALLGNVNALLTSFPADPGLQYQSQCQILLEGLNLPLLLQKEMDRLARLRSNTTVAPPPNDNDQHQIKDTNSINKTQHHDITSQCRADAAAESGLDWFHSIAPSLSPESMAPPVITSTQNSDRKPNSGRSDMSSVIKQPKCQTEKDVLSNTSSTLNHDVVLHSFGSMSSASEEERTRTNEQTKNITEKGSIIQEERQTGDPQTDSSGCVFHKISKGVRARRLRELNTQQCDKEGGGAGTAERVVSTESVSENVTNVLDKTSEYTSIIPSSAKNCLSKGRARDSLPSGKLKRFDREDSSSQTGTKSISAVLRDKMASEAETGEELHAKLSGFMFKPRKMRPWVHSRGPDAGSELQHECDPGSRDPHTSTEQPVSGNKSARRPSHTEQNTTKKRAEQHQSVSEGRSWSKQLSCVSEVGGHRSEASICFTPKRLDEAFSTGKDKSARGKTAGRIKFSDGADALCQQRSSDGTEGDGFTCSPPLKPSTYVHHAAPSTSRHTKSTVAPSTLDKLSRFSFPCTTEPTSTVDRGPPKRDGAASLRVNPKDKETLTSPEHTPSGRKGQTVGIMGKGKDILLPPGRATPGQNHDRGTECKMVSKCTAERGVSAAGERSHSVTVVTDAPVGHHSSVSLRKRKCFELGPPPPSPPHTAGASSGPLSGRSLFASVDFSTDVLDTDWDQEVSKKAKV